MARYKSSICLICWKYPVMSAIRLHSCGNTYQSGIYWTVAIRGAAILNVIQESVRDFNNSLVRDVLV